MGGGLQPGGEDHLHHLHPEPGPGPGGEPAAKFSRSLHCLKVHLEDPVRESRSDFNGNVTTREYDPVYDISQRPKQLVAGIQIELLVRHPVI